MSEELKVETPEDGAGEGVEPEVTTVDPIVEQAMEQGWVPLEEWKAAGRDESEWRPAKEFVERGELYKSIHATKRELKQTQAALTALQRHHQYVFEKAYNQALRDLKAEKRLAIRNEDFERLEEIETEIEKLNEEHARERTAMAAQQAAAQQAVVPEFEMFTQRNPWYLTDKQLRDEADAIGFVYLNNGGDKSTLLQHVEKEIKRKFPEKFGIRRAAPNAVAPVARSGRAAKAESIQLTPEEERVMKTFVDMGIMSKEDYIKELKKVGR